MKFCQPHWDALREAITARDMGDLIAPDGQTVVAQMKDQLERQEPSLTNFEPLMGAHFAILTNVMNLVGLAVYAPNEDGSDRCPLCFVRDEHKAFCTDPDCTLEDYDDWIDRAADDQLAAWKKLQEEAA